jgi:cytochrome c oxidase assembly protein subunit 15
VGLWLLASAGITIGMIVVGGYVRLNKAGLSMVRWEITRMTSPRTEEAWEKEFKDYQDHPQYKNDFPDLSLEGFKFIYLLEHYHRQLGKFLGVFFMVPALLFSFGRVLNKKMIQRALLITTVIGIQGCIGMWMVKSGLKENLGNDFKKNDVRVSHYRLAIHFSFGVTTYFLLLNSALLLLQKPQVLKTNFNFLLSNSVIRKNLMLSVHLVLFTAIFGSLLAGQDGGKIVNTYPKMGDIWYPSRDHYEKNLNFLRNNLENTFLVHFNHRVLGTVTLSTILCKNIFNYIILDQTYKVLGLGNLYAGAARGFVAVAFCSMLQFYLGVLSVLTSVPIKLAHLHQVNFIIFILNLVCGNNDCDRLYCCAKPEQKNQTQ